MSVKASARVATQDLIDKVEKEHRQMTNWRGSFIQRMLYIDPVGYYWPVRDQINLKVSPEKVFSKENYPKAIAKSESCPQMHKIVEQLQERPVSAPPLGGRVYKESSRVPTKKG